MHLTPRERLCRMPTLTGLPALSEFFILLYPIRQKSSGPCFQLCFLVRLAISAFGCNFRFTLPGGLAVGLVTRVSTPPRAVAPHANSDRAPSPVRVLLLTITELVRTRPVPVPVTVADAVGFAGSVKTGGLFEMEVRRTLYGAGHGKDFPLLK